ncbi:MAG: GNAT family N-acetyltransferase [bacterium]
METRLQQLKSLYRNGGLKTVTSKIIGRLVKTVVEKDAFVIWERAIGNGAREIAAAEKAQVKVRQATPEDVDVFADIDGLTSDKLELLQQRLGRNTTCFLVSEGEKTRGFIWLTEDKELIAEEFEAMLLHVSVKEHEAYMYDLYLAPENRGQALSISLMKALLEEAARRGYTKLYCLTRANYLPANWTMRLISCRQKGKVYLSSALGRKRIVQYEILS